MDLLKLAVLAPRPSRSPSINGNFLLIVSFVVSVLLLAGVENQTFKSSLVCLVWLSIQGRYLNGRIYVQWFGLLHRWSRFLFLH